MFDLLFNVPKGALVLIDEPEISLHVVWQLAFIPDVQRIASLSGFRFIVATHSPQIINDAWARAVRLARGSALFMKEALNENTLFNTLAMARQNVASLILVVEGEDDYFLLKAHHNSADLLLIPGRGRPTTLATAELADKRGLAGVRFLVDSDYDRFSSTAQAHPSNVLFSTHHDLIMDALLADVQTFNRLIAAYARGAERRGIEVDVDLIRRRAFALAASVAPFRIVNERNSLELNLAKFPFGKVASMSPTQTELATLVIERTNTALTVDLLVGEIGQERAHHDSPVELLVGDHDLFRALARVLREHGATATADALFTSFLAAVTCAQVMATNWYETVMNWGRRNSRTPFLCPCAA